MYLDRVNPNSTEEGLRRPFIDEKEFCLMHAVII